MDVAEQFMQICIFLADNGFVSILEKVAASFMALVEINGIARKKPPHEPGKSCLIAAEEQMKMIGHNGPGKAISTGIFKKVRKTAKEFCAVFIIEKNIAFFYTAHNDMLKQTRDIQAWFSWHEISIPHSFR